MSRHRVSGAIARRPLHRLRSAVSVTAAAMMLVIGPAGVMTGTASATTSGKTAPKAGPGKHNPAKVVPSKAVPSKAVPSKAVPSKAVAVAPAKAAPVAAAAKRPQPTRYSPLRLGNEIADNQQPKELVKPGANLPTPSRTSTSTSTSADAARIASPGTVRAAGVTAGTTGVMSAAASCSNPVQCENLLPGDPRSDWSITEPGDTQLQGYATNQSVNVGQTISFKINSSTLTSYHIDILRAGWYQGLGARKIVSGMLPSAALPQTQPACQVANDGTGLVDCGNWATSASWAVPSTAVSGVYFAHLVRNDNGNGSYIFFDVRNDASHSDIIYQTSDATREAYNQYGGNSLYECTVSCPSGYPQVYKAAYKVSFNRPNTAVALGGQYSFFGAEDQMVEFLEANGYDVSYMSGVDTDRYGSTLLENHKMFMSSGHDEYWSGTQRANVEKAEAAGVNLSFFSGNEVFWKTRYENSIDGSGTPYRTLVSYKETHFSAPVDPQDPPTWTGTWRDPTHSPPADGGRPENGLTGTAYTVDPPSPFALQVPAADGKLRLWRNTAAATQQAGQTLTLAPNTLGYEFDEDLDNGARPAGNFDLSTTTEQVTHHLDDFGNVELPGTATHHLTEHREASGALVFGAGTVQWSWGLEGSPDGKAGPNTTMQQATINLFADMGLQPTTLIAGLVPATRTTDTTPPKSAITSPASGASTVADSPETISGTATESTGGQVGGVEVSVDGGSTWHPAIGRASWSYTWIPTLPGTITIETRSVNDSGYLETPSDAQQLTVTSRSCPCSIWSPSATPKTIDGADGSAIEVGVRFHSDQTGYITGVRFYKAATNTGTHLGNLWTSTGTLLASATFTNESGSGWQQVNFASPVAITAGTDYIASYHTNTGHYSADPEAFFKAAYDAPPLHADADQAGAASGVYAYGTASVFPTSQYESSNFWVDVVFTPSFAAPTVTSTSPAANAIGAPVSAPVTAGFNESVLGSSITFGLTNSSGSVAGSMSYNDSTHTATFTPSAPLANSTRYTATVSGATDASGNKMSGPYSWSFTTAAAAGTCPCTIFSANSQPIEAAASDAAPVEVGVKFHSDQSGYITGVRFYKGSTNTGTHVAGLWTISGTLLASATFGSETASGWQQVNFASPVPITAGTDYVAGYHMNSGHYADDGGAFAGAGIDNAPLHALKDGADGGNGVYAYSANSTIPNQTYNSTNYWVDVVFTTAANVTPTVTSTAPAANSTGASVTGAVSATFNESVQGSSISFGLTNSSGNVAGSVSYSDSTHTATFTPSAALAYSTRYTATVSGATDASGNKMSGPYSWSFTTAASSTTCPCTIFSAASAPGTASASDPAAVEVGVKFHSDSTGYVTGIRFYKGSTNTGTHIGDLWTTSGTLLATATFGSETATGWQQVNFASPVPVAAGTDYVASYHTGTGHYAADAGAFATAGIDNAPLHALKDGVDGGDGVYAYGATSTFPNQTYNSTDYWVDVVFTNTGTVTPAVTSTSPAANATGASVGAAITAGFNESVQGSSITFGVADSSGNVAGSVSYSDSTHTATFTPSAALAYSTRYTATVSGATDASGNKMSGPYSWSFTTSVAPNNCPCTIFSAGSKPGTASAPDPGAVEVGVKFHADQSGHITGIRFYKGSTNTGSHIGNLWTTSGTLLATATFSSETASGWQQVNFATPVAITAGTDYVASYHTNAGNYAADLAAFAGAGVDNAPLHALKDGADGGDGVYAYGATSTFPNQTYDSTNYWVDVVFTVG